jgi:hypothetical protein
MPVADSAPQTWIVRTGQRRKAMVTLAIACLAPVGSVLAFSFGEGAVAIALLVVAALSFVTFASAVPDVPRRGDAGAMSDDPPRRRGNQGVCCMRKNG